MTDKVAAFRALHIPGDPLILVNIWDAGSAKAVERPMTAAMASFFIVFCIVASLPC